MMRRLFTLLAGLSLACCLAVGCLWARSIYWAVDLRTFDVGRSELCIVSVPGRLEFWFFGRDSGMRRFGLPNMMYIPVTQWLPLFKFEQSNDGFPYPYGQTVRAEVADILVMAVFALLPAAWVIIRLRPRKPPAGHCQACGYDLRGTPADNACPECGAIPSPATISP